MLNYSEENLVNQLFKDILLKKLELDLEFGGCSVVCEIRLVVVQAE